ncbi:MAG TPA: GNAT family N-acetyltransferase [Hyphomicrobium sp.]|nr:GNAT family N-acetyltransferase [Hyphomicrobium sp.]
MNANYPLRPYLPADAMALRELFAQSIEELTQEDYDEDQRLAWISRAEDAAAFARRLAAATTLVIQVEGEYLGFASLKDNKVLDMLYVHPHHAGEGVGSALCEALEKIAAARGAQSITADSSETAVLFFEGRGYVPVRRSSVPVDDMWLTNTAMTKPLKPQGTPPAKPH